MLKLHQYLCATVSHHQCGENCAFHLFLLHPPARSRVENPSTSPNRQVRQCKQRPTNRFHHLPNRADAALYSKLGVFYSVSPAVNEASLWQKSLIGRCCCWICPPAEIINIINILRPDGRYIFPFLSFYCVSFGHCKLPLACIDEQFLTLGENLKWVSYCCDASYIHV